MRNGNPYVLQATVCGNFLVVFGAVYDNFSLYDKLLPDDYKFSGDGAAHAVIETGLQPIDLEQIALNLCVKYSE